MALIVFVSLLIAVPIAPLSRSFGQNAPGYAGTTAGAAVIAQATNAHTVTTQRINEAQAQMDKVKTMPQSSTEKELISYLGR
jgi:hypothetical protein